MVQVAHCINNGGPPSSLKILMLDSVQVL